MGCTVGAPARRVHFADLPARASTTGARRRGLRSTAIRSAGVCTQSGRYTVSTTDPQQPSPTTPVTALIRDIFGDTPPLESAEDLAADGIFDDGEVDEFLT